MATSVQQHIPMAVVIWVDGWHALIARNRHGHPTVTEVDREADSPHDYFLRVARAAEDCDRLMLLGPGDAMFGFERDYEALYRRSDRFVDAETTVPPTERELIERLHLIDPDER